VLRRAIRAGEKILDMAPQLAKNWTIERLRLAVLILAGVLLLAIVGFVIYSHWRLRHIAQDLPARLGISIQQTTRGYVLSKTEQGRTIFTLHAARAIQFKSGKRVSLHDVQIDMYSRSGGPPDTISGSDFEFDPSSEIVTSHGETHIVLYPPQNTTAAPTKKNQNQPVRVITNGLVFSQKTGVATCTGEVDFQIADSSGQATGASYESKQGRLTLQSQVAMTTVVQNRPAVLHASHAVYERNASQVHLLDARYSSVQPNGTERAQARTATVTLRRDGSVDRLDAAGDVRLVSADGASVRSAVMTTVFGQKSQPQQAHFSGDVQFAQSQDAQQTSGSSREAQINFDARGRATLAIFDGSVRFWQVVDSTPAHLKRTLSCDHLTLHLRPVAAGQSQLESSEANGSAVFTSQSTAAGQGSQATTLAAQNLNAKFRAGNQLQHIDGTGQTRVRTVGANGDINTSTGDVLAVDFAETPISAGKKIAAASVTPINQGSNAAAVPAQSIESAVQTGNVVLRQTASAKSNAGRPAVSTAYGSRAEYSAANNTLTLTGNPKFRNDQLEMTAEKIQVNRATGNATFSGAVQSTLEPADHARQGGDHDARQQPPGGLLGDNRELAHVIAEQATLLHDREQATFSGRARLWQGADSVEAPVIELSQKMQTLSAHGNPSCSDCVFSNFVGNSAPKAANPASGVSVAKTPASDFRIRSSRLLYSDAERKANFMGGVRIVSADGVLSSNQAEVLLTDAGASAADRSVSSAARSAKNQLPFGTDSGQSSVKKIIATGSVRLTQPGRRATGMRLVYTASDGHFVLTGDSETPPSIFDADRGTVTGQVLTFTSPGQAIIVTGNAREAATTRTRVKKS
jgi:lipopolysaccharide export system protein LptA